MITFNDLAKETLTKLVVVLDGYMSFGGSNTVETADEACLKIITEAVTISYFMGYDDGRDY